VMETGYDILFFWVARMVMSGLAFTGKPPFHTIYLHGLIRDEHGQKMSKTKGNVIDPLIVMDEYGTDALRFTLLVGSTPGKDMNLSVKKVEANRNFANKVWNAGRFTINAISQAPASAENPPEWTPADEYIHARMRAVIRDVNRLFETYQFGEAGRQIYDFFWSEFADWYIESAKIQLRRGGDQAYYTAWTLMRVLDKCLRLLHPFTPYVTEELWGRLRDASLAKGEGYTAEDGWGEALIIAAWPLSKEIEDWESAAVSDFSDITIEHTKALRTLKTDLGIPVRKKVNAHIITGKKLNQKFIQQTEYIRSLASIDNLGLSEKITGQDALKGHPSASIPATGSVAYLITSEDISNEEVLDKINAELKNTEGQIKRLEKLLASDFAIKAPPPVVKKEQEKLESFRAARDKLKKQLESVE